MKRESGQATKWADQLDNLADDYERFSERLPRLLPHYPSPKERTEATEAVESLRRVGELIRTDGRTLRSRSRDATRYASVEHQLSLGLSEHMALTTGKYHDREVANLVNTFRTKGTTRFSAGSVEQLRRRERLRVWPIQSRFFYYVHDKLGGFPLFDVLDELQDDETFAAFTAAMQKQDPVDMKTAFSPEAVLKAMKEGKGFQWESTPTGLVQSTTSNAVGTRRKQ